MLGCGMSLEYKNIADQLASENGSNPYRVSAVKLCQEQNISTIESAIGVDTQEKYMSFIEYHNVSNIDQNNLYEILKSAASKELYAFFKEKKLFDFNSKSDVAPIFMDKLIDNTSINTKSSDYGYIKNRILEQFDNDYVAPFYKYAVMGNLTPNECELKILPAVPLKSNGVYKKSFHTIEISSNGRFKEEVLHHEIVHATMNSLYNNFCEPYLKCYEDHEGLEYHEAIMGSSIKCDKEGQVDYSEIMLSTNSCFYEPLSPGLKYREAMRSGLKYREAMRSSIKNLLDANMVSYYCSKEEYDNGDLRSLLHAAKKCYMGEVFDWISNFEDFYDFSRLDTEFIAYFFDMLGSNEKIDPIIWRAFRPMMDYINNTLYPDLRKLYSRNWGEGAIEIKDLPIYEPTLEDVLREAINKADSLLFREAIENGASIKSDVYVNQKGQPLISVVFSKGLKSLDSSAPYKEMYNILREKGEHLVPPEHLEKFKEAVRDVYCNGVEKGIFTKSIVEDWDLINEVGGVVCDGVDVLSL